MTRLSADERTAKSVSAEEDGPSHAGNERSETLRERSSHLAHTKKNLSQTGRQPLDRYFSTDKRSVRALNEFLLYDIQKYK